MKSSWSNGWKKRATWEDGTLEMNSRAVLVRVRKNAGTRSGPILQKKAFHETSLLVGERKASWHKSCKESPKTVGKPCSTDRRIEVPS